MARSDRFHRRSLRLLVGASALAGAVLACNGILGLGDFEAVECTGGVCDGGAGFEGGQPDAGDGGEGGALVDANGTAPVSWAHFRMPNYPQLNGPDANVPTYSAATGGGFQDSVSGLVWREPIPELGGHTFAEAQAICAAAGTSGVAWRLPSRIELVTLLDFTQNPAIDPKTFGSTEGSAYWTSSEVRPFGDGGRFHWTVNFGSPAGLGQLEESRRAGVRCIRAQ